MQIVMENRQLSVIGDHDAACTMPKGKAMRSVEFPRCGRVTVKPPVVCLGDHSFELCRADVTERRVAVHRRSGEWGTYFRPYRTADQLMVNAHFVGCRTVFSMMQHGSELASRQLGRARINWRDGYRHQHLHTLAIKGSGAAHPTIA